MNTTVSTKPTQAKRSTQRPQRMTAMSLAFAETQVQQTIAKARESAINNAKRPAAEFLPENDGQDHINVHNNAKTDLGKLLAHFPKTPFEHPYYGPFHSMEGFWHYILAQKPDERLRKLYGYKAKELGKTLERRQVENFRAIIIAANFYKIEQTPELRKMLMQSTLPFDHYYQYGPGQVLVRPHGFYWLVEGFEEIRKMFKEGRRPEAIDYTA